MCRLLGVVANKPVDFEFSLKQFRKQGKYNPDGWGIGWYENGKAKHYREPKAAYKSEKYVYYSREVHSKIIVAHVRRTSGSRSAEKNSHPFLYSPEWLFAHNGTVGREKLYSQLKENYRRAIEGETDSEVYFYWILQNIKQADSVVEGIKKAVTEIVKHGWYSTGLNFLLANSKTLYAFRYARNNLDYYSLYQLKRDPLQIKQEWESYSEETEALLKSKSLNKEKAVLICSEKLTEENWEEITPGVLVEIGKDLTITEHEIGLER